MDLSTKEHPTKNPFQDHHGCAIIKYTFKRQCLVFIALRFLDVGHTSQYFFHMQNFKVFVGYSVSSGGFCSLNSSNLQGYAHREHNLPLILMNFIILSCCRIHVSLWQPQNHSKNSWFFKLLHNRLKKND